jgi:hypothetical protein
MAQRAERRVSIRSVAWLTGPEGALPCTLSQDRPGRVECVLQYLFIPVLSLGMVILGLVVLGLDILGLIALGLVSSRNGYAGLD